MKRILLFGLVLVLAMASPALPKKNPDNTPDSTEAKAAIESMLLSIEKMDYKAFAEFLPDTGIIETGMNGGMIAFYDTKPSLIYQLNHGMIYLSRLREILDFQQKLKMSARSWSIIPPPHHSRGRR